MYFASRVYVAFRAPIGLRLCSLDRFLLPRAWVPALNMLLIAFVPGVLLPLLYIGDYIAFLALAALTFLTLLKLLGSSLLFWVYGGICAVALVFSVFMVPETRGRSLEEIEANLRAGKPPRQLGDPRSTSG